MDVIRQRCEYLLVVLEEEGMVIVDTVENQHVQGVDHILPAHEGVQTEDDLLCFCLADV